jgi:opacity protein-like surface antigen
VLASGTQIYSLSIANDVTLTPVYATVGYRAQKYGRIVPYLGVGLGWQTLEERSPSFEDARRSQVGFHIAAGAEYSLLRWVSVAGEVQRTIVPNVLGETGASALFTEDDLGGTTFRVKLIVGR